MNCACGCGHPVSDPPRGGYNSRVQRSLWFASGRCQAVHETYLLKTVQIDDPDLRLAATKAKLQRHHHPKPRSKGRT